jgi:hypothetical protein
MTMSDITIYKGRHRAIVNANTLEARLWIEANVVGNLVYDFAYSIPLDVVEDLEIDLAAAGLSVLISWQPGYPWR